MSQPTNENSHPLLAELILWIEGVTFDYKQIAFQRIKRKMLKDDLKRLHKNNFESVSSTSANGYMSNNLSNYVSITDFKPIQQNYSSIKIIDYQTHGVKNDIKSSLARKIQYTSTQLLDKQTFLQNWMIRNVSTQTRPQNYPYSDYSIKKINSYNQQALNSVRRFTFNQFCKINLKRRGGFFSLTEIDPLKYKKTLISSSLTHLPDTENEIAIEAFQILLKAGGQAQSQYSYLYQISQLIEITAKSNDNIKEQIFFQVIKQITSKRQIYLRILCCLCYCIKVSTRLYIPLLNYLYEEASLYQSMPKELLNYCFFHLIKNFDKSRLSTPSLFEIFCAFYASKIPVKVSFPKQKLFFIQSYTTIQQFMAQLVQYYNLDPDIPYLIQLNGFLMEKGNLLDNLNYYSLVDIEDYKWKDYEFHTGIYAIIVLKNVDDINHSQRCYNIMYNYCSSQYLRGLYSLKSTDIVKIAALKMVSQIESEEKYSFQYDNLISKRKLQFLTTTQQKQHYKKHILRQYFKLKHLSKAEARKQILEILSKSKGFNTHFFKSLISIDDYDDFIAWVGVQKDKFIIVQPNTGRLMKNIYFSAIKQWGKSKSELCLKIDHIGLFHIDTKQVEVLTSVFQTYLEYQAKLLRVI